MLSLPLLVTQAKLPLFTHSGRSTSAIDEVRFLAVFCLSPLAEIDLQRTVNIRWIWLLGAPKTNLLEKEKGLFFLGLRIQASVTVVIHEVPHCRRKLLV